MPRSASLHSLTVGSTVSRAPARGSGLGLGRALGRGRDRLGQGMPRGARGAGPPAHGGWR